MYSWRLGVEARLLGEDEGRYEPACARTREQHPERERVVCLLRIVKPENNPSVHTSSYDEPWSGCAEGSSAACAAATRAIGTRNGEQLT